MKNIISLKKTNILVYAILLIITSTIVFFNMVISPIYPMVYSQYNQSILYLIGKMMSIGKVPYKDVIDHKGIYVLLLHYLAEIISGNNHIGLYIIGTIFVFISVLYIYKILFFINSKNNIKELPTIIISIISSLAYAVIISLYNVSYGTLQSETFITAFIIVSIYYFICDIYDDEFHLKYFLLYGIIFSFIIFIKANLCIYFLWIAIYIFYKETKKNKSDNKFKKVFAHLKYGVLGILIGAAPGIIYAILNNCLNEMFYYTFTVNAIYSNAPYFGLNTKLESIVYTLSKFKYIYLFFIIGKFGDTQGKLGDGVAYFLHIFDKKKTQSYNKNNVQSQSQSHDKSHSAYYINTFMIMIMLIIATLISGRDYSYYLIVLLPFVSIIINNILKIIYLILTFIKVKVIKNVLIVFALICIVFASWKIALINGRDLMVKNGKEQLKVAKFIKNSYRNVRGLGKKNLYILGTEIYAYDYVGVLPEFKYFAIPMIEFKYYKEPYEEALKYLEEKNADVVIIGQGGAMSEFYKYTNLTEFLDNNYSMIGMELGRTALTPK